MKGENVYKGLMTLFLLKWKRTVLFCNLGFVKHVSQRKHCFLKILIYTISKQMSFQNGLEKKNLFILDKSRYTTEITNQGTQPKSQVKVHNKDT